ncbi:MAG: RluA family pseudouridine synthase [Oscillospiraceae bacterium]|nr:RluA family pseudouridine synthase [Oscillospiraceae bacterium]
MQEGYRFIVGAEMDGAAAERFLRSCGVSRRLLIKLKRTDGGITRNGQLLRSSDIVREGDIVVLREAATEYNDVSDAVNVPKVYENDDMVIYDKPCNMPVHPSQRHRGDTLYSAFVSEYKNLTFRPINRLDKDTTGLCIAAKSAYSAAALQKSYEKVYYAAVCGIIDGGGVVDAPIDREGESIIKRCVSANGKRAVTEYEPVMHSEKYTLLKIKLHTGRTHQIRVHMSYLGYPLAGDDMYGGNCEDISRQALHCGEISVKDPFSKNVVNVVSPLPDDILRLFGGKK